MTISVSFLYSTNEVFQITVSILAFGRYGQGAIQWSIQWSILWPCSLTGMCNLPVLNVRDAGFKGILMMPLVYFQQQCSALTGR